MNNRRDEIYDSITKKQIGILLAAGGLIGAVIFIICYGFAVLDVTNDGWLLKGGDLIQHYVGWKAYRQSPWQFPIGMTEGLIYPDETCVIYTIYLVVLRSSTCFHRSFPNLRIFRFMGNYELYINGRYIGG